MKYTEGTILNSFNFEGIAFDYAEADDKGLFSYVCASCANKLETGELTVNEGNAECGVKGCKKEGEYYVSFPEKIRFFNVTDATDNKTVTLNENELKELAAYYYNNSEVTEDIDFAFIENAIAFVRRVDKVEELTNE